MGAIGVDIVGYLIFACAMVGTPGPANMVLLAAGARFGLRASLPFAAGVILGKQLIIWPIGFGLMALAASVPVLFTILKWGSAAYILYLATRIAMAKIVPGQAGQAAPGFARWFGVEVTEDDVAAARALIEDDLKKEQG